MSLSAQILDPALLTKPDGSVWATYYGDYSGRRYSSLAQINRDNVASLALAWTFRTGPVTAPTFEGLAPRAAPVTSVPLQIGGTLYFTLSDHVWAIDARTGRQIWHF